MILEPARILAVIEVVQSERPFSGVIETTDRTEQGRACEVQDLAFGANALAGDIRFRQKVVRRVASRSILLHLALGVAV